MSVGLLLISVMTACLCVLYTEGLDEKACVKFVCDHFSYFGEPLAMMLVAPHDDFVVCGGWIPCLSDSQPQHGDAQRGAVRRGRQGR